MDFVCKSEELRSFSYSRNYSNEFKKVFRTCIWLGNWRVCWCRSCCGVIARASSVLVDYLYIKHYGVSVVMLVCQITCESYLSSVPGGVLVSQRV